MHFKDDLNVQAENNREIIDDRIDEVKENQKILQFMAEQQFHSIEELKKGTVQVNTFISWGGVLTKSSLFIRGYKFRRKKFQYPYIKNETMNDSGIRKYMFTGINDCKYDESIWPINILISTN